MTSVTAARVSPGTHELRKAVVAWVIGSVAILTIPLLPLTNEQFSLATSATIYASIAAGLGLLYGQLGLLSMSHAALWGVGSYSAFIMAYHLHWGFWPAIGFSIVASMLIGGATALPAFRLRSHHLLIMTFLVTLLFAGIESHWTSLTGGNDGLLVTRPPDGIFGLSFTSPVNFYYLVAGALVLLLGFYHLLTLTSLGHAFVALRENGPLAQALGINPQLYLIIGFMLSGLFAGIGGTLFAYQVKQVEPTFFGLDAVVLLPLVVILGGSRQVWGSTVGAFVVQFLPLFLHLTPLQAQAANGLVLVLIILVLPFGIIGSLEIMVVSLLGSRRHSFRATRRSVPGRST